MKASLSRLLAITLAMAGVSFFQLTELHAGTRPASLCDEASCLLQEAQAKDGKTDQAAPPQKLALKIKIGIDCPRGFFWDGGGCVQERRHKRMGCPDGTHWNGDECVFNRKGKKQGGGGCVVGFHWNGHKCVPDRKGKKQGGGGCVVGFHWNGKKCVPDKQGKKKTQGNEFPPVEGQGGGDGFQCSHNDHMENGKCVPCKAGFHVEGDECVAD